jgi:hypothetical protein
MLCAVPRNLWVTLPALLIVAAGTAWFGGITTLLLEKLELQKPLPGVGPWAQLAALVSAAAGWLISKAQSADPRGLPGAVRAYRYRRSCLTWPQSCCTPEYRRSRALLEVIK